MVLPPRELMFRLVFWAAVFGWAVWKMQDLRTGDLVVPEMLAGPPAPTAAPVVSVPPPATRAPVEGAAPDVVDPEAAFTTMEAALRGAAGCHVVGTLGVRLGPDGLAEAWVRNGAVPVGDDTDPLDATALACLSDALWALGWPRTTLGFEIERDVTDAVGTVPTRAPAAVPSEPPPDTKAN